MRVYVSQHALERWRLRRAERMDAPASEVMEAVASSKPLAEGESVPGKIHHPGTTYWRCDVHDCWFVLEGIAADEFKVVTVLTDGFDRQVRRPADAPAVEAEVMATDPQARVVQIQKELGKMPRADPRWGELMEEMTQLRAAARSRKEDRKMARNAAQLQRKLEREAGQHK